MPLISLDDEDQRWVPTHVNVTVLRARGLRTKGKHGSRYVYTIIQLGKEKYTTGLVEKAAEPEWNEECTFELLPGLLELAGTNAYPPGSSNLVLTVMHRVLIGLDVFLGQAIVSLDKLFEEGICPRNEWLKLHSKVGRPEKERGDLQVTVQFTRNNLTASMYDLSVKDKRRSAFGKLKDRVTGRKRDVESSSAIVPGRYAALSQGSLGQPFGDGGGGGGGGVQGEDEQQVEDPPTAPPEERERRGSKVKDFFGKLRKSSDTRSCSSLASDSSVASSAGEPFCPQVELSSTPIYSSRVLTDSFRGDTETGGKAFTPHDPKVMTHKRAYSDEASKVTTTTTTTSSSTPRPCPAVETLQGQSMVLSKSSLCINGSHVYSSEPASPKANPAGALPARRALLEKCSPLSRSLQNLTRRADDPQKAAVLGADGRRWSFDKTKKEEADQTDQGSTSTDESSSQTGGAAGAAAAAAADPSDKGKKPRRTLFSSGRSDSLPSKSDPSQAGAAHEGRLRGWFGTGDSQNKPSLEVSPKVENSPDTPLPLHPPHHLHSQSQHPSPAHPKPAPATTPPSPGNGCHANPFTPSPPASIPIAISPSNPFLTRLQTNPFFEELLAEEALKSPPASGYSGSPLSQYAAFHVRPGLPSPGHQSGVANDRANIKRERPRSVARQRSLPVLLPGSSGQPAGSLPNSSTNRSLSEHTTEWDESFEAFAASRLKSPNGTPSAPNPMTTQRRSASVSDDRVLLRNPDVSGCGVQEGFSQARNVPPLPPRRPEGPSFRERSSESWLERAEELAVQREACFLTQSDLASRQHLKGRKHRRNTKSWAAGEELPHESVVAELHSNLAHHQFNTSLASTITEDAEAYDLNDRALMNGEDIWASERDSPGAQERRNMERKNNALNFSNLDINKDVIFNMGFATEQILAKSPLCDDNPLNSSDFTHSIRNKPACGEKTHEAQQKVSPTDTEASDKSLCDLNLMPDCTSDYSGQTQVTNGIGSLVASEPGFGTNIDSSDFAFVDSDSSPSEMTINTLEIYDQNANKMLAAYQMFSAVDSAGNPMSTLDPTATDSDLKTSELEMLSRTTSSHTGCETKQVFEHCVLEADSVTDEQRDCSPHYKSSRAGKGGCKAHGDASFDEAIKLDIGDERHTNFKCELPHSPLNLSNHGGSVLDPETRGTKMTATEPTNCMDSPPLLDFASRDNDSFTDAVCNKDGCVSSELCSQALPQMSDRQRQSQPSDQQNEQFDQSLAYNTRLNADPTGEVVSARGGGSHTDYERLPGDAESREGSHTQESELSDLESTQWMSFADLHAQVAPSPSTSARTTWSPLHGSASPSCSPSSRPTPVTDTNTKPDPNSHLDPSTPHHSATLRVGGGPNPSSPPTSCPSTCASATVSSCSSCTVQPMVDPRHTVTPGETQPASSLLPQPESSPHPVKPLTTSAPPGERRSEGRSVLEKLKSTIAPGRSTQPTAAEVAEREARMSEARAQYQNMTNMELISLLLQQEVEVERQRAESEQQGALLEKREAELKKMKVQVRDLEDYIDKLLVRIMEQTPTLLQVRSRYK
ncbi:hypothetical protein ACEWY4_027212 [Coilia grayii]|uniref:Uncharacterized protein n=1 Tax=Coilia grayii TaxID=363190 RepID=A0ABD1IRT9_9TELE